jgi:hypothetical protein
MARKLHIWIMAAGALLLTQGLAQAQYQFGPPTGPPGPGSMPVISPYLNLFRGDQSLLLNYWGLVQPQFAFQRSIGGLQQQVTGNTATETQLLNAYSSVAALPPTGVGAGFMTQRAYFMTLQGGGGAFGIGRGVGIGGGGVGGGGAGIAAAAAGAAPGAGGAPFSAGFSPSGR